MNSPSNQTYDLCVVGAGIAGLNALFVASQYLSGSQRIALVDSRPRVGGMWVDTYPYVRLHQPHPFFTAGNIEWTFGKDPSHLATKAEVLDHFQHCLDVIKQRVQVDEYFGWTLESTDEADGVVQLTCRSASDQETVITAKRVVKAFGIGVMPNQPLPLTSTRVQSVSPDFCDVRNGAIADSTAPVWVIGGGKTAMDTAHALITAYPGREVNLLAGSGTFFADRNKFYLRGVARWVRGSLPSTALRGTALTFDGSNEGATADQLRADYGVSPTPRAPHFLLGVLSEEESTTIAAGVNQIVMDHLVDIVDRGDVVELQLRSGATRTIQAGSWIINCTGYLGRVPQPYEPYVSDSGRVLSLNTRSAALHLPAFMGYFLTHLLFLDKLTSVPLYELDWQELQRKGQTVLPYAMVSLAHYNLSLIFDAVPAKVFADCGLDFDRWYPLPRRLLATARFMATHRREREHHRQALDTVRERFDVRCGPLENRAALPHR